MGQEDKRDRDEILPEFGVTRRELEADVKRRIASLDAGAGKTTQQLRDELRQRQRDRAKAKGRRLSSR
ncbi:hypothetical protein [Dongia sp.]|uniref:hypothetical protein n=1 Tax=Dongia sp. TaxID=1977262 RepID=UPI003752A4C8